jgi:hypothetical protein
MSLDTRLQQHFQQTAWRAPSTTAPDALDTVVARAAHLRRNRRRMAYAAVLTAAAVFAAAWGLTATNLHILGLGDHPVVDDSHLMQNFRSSLYHYSIIYPATWKATPATRLWLTYPPDDKPSQDDRLTAPDGTSWSITSLEIPAGTNPMDWLRQRAKAPLGMPGGCFLPLHKAPRTRVDGFPAWIHGGLAICNFTEAYVLVGHHFYQFGAHPSLRTLNDHVYDPNLFRALLKSVQFSR